MSASTTLRISNGLLSYFTYILVNYTGLYTRFKLQCKKFDTPSENKDYMNLPRAEQSASDVMRFLMFITQYT